MLTLNSSCLLPPALSTWLSSFQVRLSPCFFFFFHHISWLLASWSSHQGWNSHPLQWKHGVLTTGLPGNSLVCLFLPIFLKNIYSVPSILQKLSYYFLNMYLFTWLLWVLVTAHGSSSLTRVWTRPPVLGVLRPHHWTTREALSLPVSE